MSFTIAIVGRPNVGKSTLFNRLAGRKLALVDDLPGVTRDRREGAARLGDLVFTIVDTAGLEQAGAKSLAGRMLAQTESAIAMADADDRHSIGVLLGAQRQQFTHGQVDEARSFIGRPVRPLRHRSARPTCCHTASSPPSPDAIVGIDAN